MSDFLAIILFAVFIDFLCFLWLLIGLAWQDIHPEGSSGFRIKTGLHAGANSNRQGIAREPPVVGIPKVIKVQIIEKAIWKD